MSGKKGTRDSDAGKKKMELQQSIPTQRQAIKANERRDAFRMKRSIRSGENPQTGAAA